MTLETRLFLASAICFVAFLALGYAVCRRRQLWPLDARARALIGQATPLAALFTLSGRAFALAAVAIAAIVGIFALHGNLVVAAAILAAQTCSQGVAEFAKRRFRRARPDDWIFHQELGFSYPSGHASTAALFFGSWLVYAVSAGGWSPQVIAAVAVLSLWIAGIDWSRLALGAHYPTDVAGGTLFGCGWLWLLWGALLHFGALHPK
ncbi:MAG TPA: phosphatase PAP2 family protein [Candidatus Baltobacteraceae bacterium]